MSSPLPPLDRVALRRELRARRRAIQGNARRTAALQVARLIDAERWLRPGRHIGLYLAMSEELDTGALLQLALRRGCHIALPRIVSKRHNRMRFYDHTAGPDTGSIRSGAFGIAEPQGNRLRAARAMDVVFMPLVGFDPQGHRIGMGRGFYDRYFAHRARLASWRRPLLIGLAYDVQRMPALPASAHDVPLDAIVTESTVLKISRRPA
ncbi:MAG TPA: 5-formyltetrahydrofolate cyclo-ligase [Steroidobacteraceae bacterium]|nr:5-formyltetrahydrofolate cyclo-ligase [Steroidobacteraceae bacterium]